jgi:hypothetical protein
MSQWQDRHSLRSVAGALVRPAGHHSGRAHARELRQLTVEDLGIARNSTQPMHSTMQFSSSWCFLGGTGSVL